MSRVDNSCDVIDSRDVIERIAELQELADAVSEAESELADMDNASAEEIEAAEEALTDAQAEFDDDAQEELAALKSLAEEASGYAADWEYGETLIRDSYFTEYCQQMLEDCGELPRDFPHYIEIDWEATARNIRMDYALVDFAGVTYWIR